MNAVKHVVWTNHNVDYDMWAQNLKTEDPDTYGDMTEEEMLNAIDAQIHDALLAERENLNIQLNRPILVIADIGRWNGRSSGYAEIKSGNIKDCLQTGCEYATFYVDGNGDLRCEAYHHDGTNHYLFRVYKDTATDTQIENLKWKIYCSSATRRNITSITSRLGVEIAKVYGW